MRGKEGNHRCLRRVLFHELELPLVLGGKRALAQLAQVELKEAAILHVLHHHVLATH